MAHLSSLRRQAGLTQAQLADRVGVTIAAIKAWENGRRAPSARSVAALYSALNMSSDDVAALFITPGRTA
jgi:putative transcriptional regulator